MAYKSGEFGIPVPDHYDYSTNNFATSILNDTLFVTGYFTAQDYSGSSGMSFQTTFDLTKLIKTAANDSGLIDDTALKNQADWQTQSMNLPLSLSKPALVTMTETLFMFLNEYLFSEIPADVTASLTALKYNVPEGTPTNSGTWSSAVTLLESDGATAPKNNPLADVSATAVGDNIIIVTCAQASSPTNPTGGTFVGIYDTTKLDTANNNWAAQWHAYLPYYGPLNSSNAFHISTEWYSTVGESGKPEFYLVVFVQSSQTPDANVSPDMNAWELQMTVDEASSGITTVGLSLPLQSSFTWGQGFQYPFPVFYADLNRDPGGRLRIWNSPRSQQNKSLFATSLNTSKPIQNAYGPILLSDNLQISDNFTAPSSLFYIFEKGEFNTTVTGKQVTNYPVYEFIFYGGFILWSSGFVLLAQVNNCGTIQIIPDYSTSSPKQAVGKEISIFSGIINGPIPIPIENYKGFNPDGGDDNDAGTLTYGTETGTTQSRSVSNSWTAGFESSGEATTGVGPAWDISFKGGSGSVQENSTGTGLSYDLQQPAIIDTKDQNNPTFSTAEGTLRKVGAQFSITAFNYLDEFGPSVISTDNSSADAQKIATVLTSFVEPANASFTLYDVTPGDLISYTPQTVNARMKLLGYPGDNYYGDVICRNAYPFGTPDTPFLTYSWSEGAASGPSFKEFDATYMENSWTFDLSVYAGVSVGEGISIFGLGEEFQSKFLAGVDYSHESTQSENKDSGWGINLGDKWGPPKRDNVPNSVKAYEFRLFFLPVPKPPSTLTEMYWTNEAMKYMPSESDTPADTIDPNGACWRIVYIVTSIAYRDETTYPPYLYDNSLDKPSVYQSDSSRDKE
jgi:hypothetical protein